MLTFKCGVSTYCEIGTLLNTNNHGEMIKACATTFWFSKTKYVTQLFPKEKKGLVIYSYLLSVK